MVESFNFERTGGGVSVTQAVAARVQCLMHRPIMPRPDERCRCVVCEKDGTGARNAILGRRTGYVWITEDRW